MESRDATPNTSPQFQPFRVTLTPPTQGMTGITNLLPPISLLITPNQTPATTPAASPLNHGRPGSDILPPHLTLRTSPSPQPRRRNKQKRSKSLPPSGHSSSQINQMQQSSTQPPSPPSKPYSKQEDVWPSVTVTVPIHNVDSQDQIVSSEDLILDVSLHPQTGHEEQTGNNKITNTPHYTVEVETDKPEDKYRKWLSQFSYHLLLMALVSPNAMNAFCKPTGVRPADINADWWNNLSTQLQILSIFDAACGLGVNVYVQRTFIPQALKELRNGFGVCFKGPSQFFSNSLMLTASTAAAFAFAFTSYDAFKFGGESLAWMAFGFSQVTSSVTRYPSVKKTANKIKLLFNKNMREQKRMADKLRHLSDFFTAKIERDIEEKRRPPEDKSNQTKTKPKPAPFMLNGKDLCRLLEHIGKVTNDKPLNKVIVPHTRTEDLQAYTIFTLELAFALVISVTAFLTFTQKGFDGANLVAKLVGKNLNHLSREEDFGIGFIGGIVSSTLYCNTALAFISIATLVTKDLFWDTLWGGKRLLTHPQDTLKETYQHPKRFFRYCKLIFAGIAVWRSSGAMETVGTGVVRNTRGIFSPWFSSSPGLKHDFPTLNALGGTAVNGSSTFTEVLKKETQLKKQTPKLEAFIKHLETELLPEKMETKEKNTVNTIQYLLKFNIFKRNPEKTQVEMATFHPRGAKNNRRQEADILLAGASMSSDEEEATQHQNPDDSEEKQTPSFQALRWD